MIRRRAAIALAAFALSFPVAFPVLAATTAAKSEPPKTLTNPPAASQVIQPAALAQLLADKKAPQPLVLQVGVHSLWTRGHITGSRYTGPGEDPAGLAALKKALEKAPKQQPIVLYCGCCPWTDCPNVHPAYETARALGFKDVRVLYVTKNLGRDWIEKGYPTTKGEL